MSKTKKSFCFYYSTIKPIDETVSSKTSKGKPKKPTGETVLRCLINDSDDIIEVKELDYNQNKNYRMNNYYKAIDKDLYKFRDDLITFNEEIMEHFFKNKTTGKIFKLNVFNNYTINDAVLHNIKINSEQIKINAIPDIGFKEFVMIENCLSCGLMNVKRDIIGEPTQTYGYDFAKYYYYMMKKIRIPTSAPIFQVMQEIDYNKLAFGIYRVRVTYNSPTFRNIVMLNKNHHYTHNSLKILYKYKDKYNISFEPLQNDETYDYNAVIYENTAELKHLFKPWFDIIDELLGECSKSNWLLKTYISQAWGNLSKYNKIYVKEKDSENYDFDHLDRVTTTNQYKYYSYKHNNGVYEFIDSNKPYKHGGIARLKPFLTEYARNFMTSFIVDNNLEENVIRVQTDGLCLDKKVDFSSQGLKYYPLPEEKTTGLVTFYNANCYYHFCEECGCEYKFCKQTCHEC